MSNLETAPPEVACRNTPAPAAETQPQVLAPRAVPLGGPRGMTVRRTLPQRARSLIGAWCFADHYGPDDVAATGGMRVAGHPHTQLQTVSWLFRGEIEHRDTTGAHALVRPGELNLMTAGSGIAHSEYSTPDTTELHGAQLWVALPREHRFTTPRFDHYVPPALDHGGARVLVFLGSLLGHTSPVPTFSPLLGAEITLPGDRPTRLALDPAFEHGVLLDTDPVTVNGTSASPGDLVHLPLGTDAATLHARTDTPTRLLLLGGAPLGEQITMWWNFIGRTHDEITTYRSQWEAERTGTTLGERRYGAFPTEWTETLAAPELPNARLRPRG